MENLNERPAFLAGRQRFESFPRLLMKTHTFRDWHDDHKFLLERGNILGAKLPYSRELGWGYYGWKVWQHIELTGYLAELKYYLACRFWRKYNTVTAKSLPPTWVDRDTLLLHAMFAILCDVAEKEDWFQQTVYYIPDEEESQVYDRRDDWQEVAILYDWWVNVRPQMVKAIDAARDKWWNERRPANDHDGMGALLRPNRSDEERVLFDDLNLKDRFLEEDDEHMMLRLVKIKDVLWT
jgi:hypothetical protein